MQWPGMKLQVMAEGCSSVPSSQIGTNDAGDLVSCWANMPRVLCRELWTQLAWTPVVLWELFRSPLALNCLGVVAELTFISLEGQPYAGLCLYPTWRIKRHCAKPPGLMCISPCTLKGDECTLSDKQHFIHSLMKTSLSPLLKRKFLMPPCATAHIILFFFKHVCLYFSGKTCMFTTARPPHPLTEQQYWGLQKILYQAMCNYILLHNIYRKDCGFWSQKKNVLKAFWVVCSSQNSCLARMVWFKIRMVWTASIRITQMCCSDESWLEKGKVWVEEGGKEFVGLGDTLFLYLQ